jgi:hypothetical protein
MKFSPEKLLLLPVWLCFLLLLGCKNDTPKNDTSSDSTQTNTLFTLLSPEHTYISFSNGLTEGLNTNILLYEYFYNGAGVATGDLNGDGLEDIYFTANMNYNRLYLNKGKMQFQDITSLAGVAGREGPWKTGVTLADVNGDKKLDIYVSYSGMVRDEKRENQLFINQGNDAQGIPQFVEKAKEYGLASPAYSNQAYFFDYDRDGDLDVLLLHHNPKALPMLNVASTTESMKEDDPARGVRLLKQTNGYFDDITVKAGISGSPLTYGLGLGIADINGDGWQDFYISNDYAVPDYLYVNNHNGTFTDVLQKQIGHNSLFSMGNDIADINNDGFQDIVTLDMLPEDNRRQKLLLGGDNYAKFELNVQKGFHYQYMRNMLQLNNGNGTFSEIGQLAGVSNTDWSWAALLADYDNDGWKDLFISNGYFRDYTNLDFLKYQDDYIKSKGEVRLKREEVLALISHMPSSNVVNYIFSNNKNLTFSNKTKEWGMNRPSNSNGAAYADLDNDGDLDIVVNNIGIPAFVYQNNSEKNPQNHYLRIKLQGEKQNTQGLGAKVCITAKGKKQYLEQMPARGYLSAISPILHFGLGNDDIIDTLTITWLSGKTQMLTTVKANQVLTLSESDAKNAEIKRKTTDPFFKEITSPVAYTNPAAKVNDFKKQSLIINQLSYSGPCMAKADVNADGLEDVYIGGGSGQAGSLFLQQKGNTFSKKDMLAFEEDKACEDAKAIFFDANHDGYPDLYIATGGYHKYAKDDILLQDRLYLNDGKGNFTKSKNALPEMRVSKGCVKAGDINQDGFPDLFVGGRVIPGRYPETPASYLLINDGKGNFTNQIHTIAPQLEKLGMITDAVFLDMNGDKKEDLIVVGEWIPVSVFINTGTTLQNQTDKYFDKPYTGWWHTIAVGDFNNDKKSDLVIGNVGLNTQFKVSDKEPAELYFKDFDNNGTIDPIFCFYIQGKSYPYITRDELLDHLDMMRSRFINYNSYADATLTDILKQDELKDASHLTANHMETSLFLSSPNGRFTVGTLPLQTQYSPVTTITLLDFDKDGNQDVLLCGNNHHARLRLGRFDANYGMLLKGNGKGSFTYLNQLQSGFAIKGEVKSVVEINKTFLFGICEKPVIAYKQKE